MSSEPLTVSLDQFHWDGLARAFARPQAAQHIYREILELGTELRRTGRVRFPLSTDRYHETWLRTDRSRIDVAFAMASLSDYETMLQLDVLSEREIDVALKSVRSGLAPVTIDDVFGQGIMHAFGRTSLADSLRLARLDGAPVDDGLRELVEPQMRAVATELFQNQFEWACLSGDPRQLGLDPSIRTRYERERAHFAAEEERRSQIVRANQWDPLKAGYTYTFQLHLEAVVRRALAQGFDLEVLPLETDPMGFIETIPTVHVLAELLAGQYRNPETVWKPQDWADVRTLCQAVVYCDAVAPDKHWAAAVSRTALPGRYTTTVLRTAQDVLTFLKGLT
jgi:hypothetical protein